MVLKGSTQGKPVASGFNLDIQGATVYYSGVR
jgi:hypothetical protein